MKIGDYPALNLTTVTQEKIRAFNVAVDSLPSFPEVVLVDACEATAADQRSFAISRQMWPLSSARTLCGC